MREEVYASKAQNGIICVICGKYKHSEWRDLLDGKDTWSLERVYVSGAWREMQAADGADGTQMECVKRFMPAKHRMALSASSAANTSTANGGTCLTERTLGPWSVCM
jgi:hypothetical protein